MSDLFPRPLAVRLLRVEDDSEAACLRVDLSNGKTVRFASVSWALGGLAIGCVLLSALWFLVGTLVWPSTSAIASSPHANALWASLGRRKERLLLFMSLVQFVATTGLLSIQYPRIYESFTGNFAWALGLIRINPVIRSIDRMRDSTGGNLTQIAGTSTLVGGTDALKSIFSRDAISLPPAPEVATAIFSELARSIAGSPARATEAPFLGARSMSVASALLRRQLGIGSSSSSSVESDAPTAEAIAVPEVQNTSTIDSVRYGIPHYLVNIDISPYDAFMIVFINFLFLCAIAIALALLGGALWALVRWVKGRKAERRRRRLGLSGEAANVDALYAGGKWGRMRKKTSGPFLTVLRANTFRLVRDVRLRFCRITADLPHALTAPHRLVPSPPVHLLPVDDRIRRRACFRLLHRGRAKLLTLWCWLQSWAPIVLSVFTSVFTTAAVFILAARFFVLARRAVRPSFGSVEDPASFDAPPTLSYPFGSAPSTPPATPNPEPKRALLKAERRQIETWECGRFLASGLAPYSPLWNAHKVRSRRTTAKRRNWFKARGWWFGLVELVLAPLVTALFVGFAHRSGWTQTIAVLVIQSLLLLALCIWTPYDDKSSNGTRILWALLRVVIAGALIPFNRSLGLNEIVRCGFVSSSPSHRTRARLADLPLCCAASPSARSSWSSRRSPSSSSSSSSSSTLSSCASSSCAASRTAAVTVAHSPPKKRRLPLPPVLTSRQARSRRPRARPDTDSATASTRSTVAGSRSTEA